MKKYILLGLLMIVLGAGYIFNEKRTSVDLNQNANAISDNDIAVVPETVSNINAATENNSIPLPGSFEIKNVPFTSQAPLFNWDALHDEACEEASLIITKYYLSSKNLTADLAETEIQKMVAWEINYFGSHKNLTVQETLILAQNYYGLDNLTTKKITSLDDIKKEISQNHLVIAPTAGRLLGNPNFRSPGPVYHMLVISGYDSKGFMTQDVGTKNGRNYYYNQTILFNAIHDWNGQDDNIVSGTKNIIIVN